MVYQTKDNTIMKNIIIKYKELLYKTSILLNIIILKIASKFQTDKLLHDFIGTTITLISFLLVIIFSLSLEHILYIPFVIAITKELYDRLSKKGTPEWMDILFSVRTSVILYILLKFYN